MAIQLAVGMRNVADGAFGVTQILVRLGPATSALSAILVLAYGLQVAYAPPDGLTAEYLLLCGGNEPSHVLAGEAWRLVTYSFLHAGLFHLAMNVFPLFVVGAILNREFGSGRFLALHFLGAVVGGLALCLLGGHDIVAVGASGGIFALAGALAVLAVRGHPYANRRVLFIDLPILAATSFLPGVEWRTHAGGFATGVLLALFWTRGDWKPRFTALSDGSGR